MLIKTSGSRQRMDKCLPEPGLKQVQNHLPENLCQASRLDAIRLLCSMNWDLKKIYMIRTQSGKKAQLKAQGSSSEVCKRLHVRKRTGALPPETLLGLLLVTNTTTSWATRIIVGVLLTRLDPSCS